MTWAEPIPSKLAAGQTVAAAYRQATELLRSGRYRAITEYHPVGRLFARADVPWQDELAELDRQHIDLTDPYYWGVFKASGLTRYPVHALAADD